MDVLLLNPSRTLVTAIQIHDPVSARVFLFLFSPNFQNDLTGMYEIYLQVSHIFCSQVQT